LSKKKGGREVFRSSKKEGAEKVGTPFRQERPFTSTKGREHQFGLCADREEREREREDSGQRRLGVFGGPTKNGGEDVPPGRGD